MTYEQRPRAHPGHDQSVETLLVILRIAVWIIQLLYLSSVFHGQEALILDLLHLKVQPEDMFVCFTLSNNNWQLILILIIPCMLYCSSNNNGKKIKEMIILNIPPE